MARAKGVKRSVRCYLCGHRFDVSSRTMSTACPGCFAAIKVEDVVVKTYLPVNDLQTCGQITITRRGRVAARRIQCGEGIVCEGSMEGSVETDGSVVLGAKASWKGKALQCRSLEITDGAQLQGALIIPWVREEPPAAPDDADKEKQRVTKKKTRKTAKRTATRTPARAISAAPAEVTTRPARTSRSAARTKTKDADTEAPAAASRSATTAETKESAGAAARSSATVKTVTAGATKKKKKTTRKKTAKKKKSASKKTTAGRAAGAEAGDEP
jgi:cytoskeletal protein CcmA (bactofilin family)